MVVNSQSHNPYVGPRPFEREEQNLFFGREREISELQSLLTAHRTLLLYAASGAGKTSLLNAGLLPLMEQEGFEVLPIARVRGLIPAGVRPEDISNPYVFNTLMSWTEDEASQKTLTRMSLAEFLKTREHVLDSEGFSAPRLIIFDQFEELFTLYQEHWKQREDFFHQVAEALREDPVLRVLFVLREDYLARLDPYVSLLPERLRARYRLVRLRSEDACQAVEGPLKGSGRSFADGVAARLVGELLKTKVQSVTGETVEAVGEYAEPVQLQIVCRNLWDSLPAEVTEITSGHLRSFGDVDDALKGFYENAVQKTISETDVKEEELRRWFAQELITPAGTRGTVYRGKDDTDGIPNAAVDILENEHILRGELRAGAHWYELTHDRMIEPIRTSNETWFPDFEVKQARLHTRKTFLRYLSRASLVLAITVLIIGSFIMYQRAKEARVQAEKAFLQAMEAREQAALTARKVRELDKVKGSLPEAERKQIAQLAESLRGCKLTKALEKAVFDPKKMDLQLKNQPKFNPSKQITLEAWFNTDDLGTRQAIIYKPYKLGPGGGEPYYQYNLELRQGGTLYFALAINEIRRYIDGAFLVKAKRWYHVAATYDGIWTRLYLCGKEWGKPNLVKGNLSNYSTPLDIGVGKRGSGNPDRPFKGRLAEVRIWDVARTGDQILVDMHKRIWPTEKGLVWSNTNDIRNLALREGAKASQSTTWGEGAAERAIDGNTDGIWGHGSVTHTDNRPDSWWQVRLPSPAIIEEIVIWNRSDCCGNRLSNFRVSVLDDSSVEVWSSPKEFKGPVEQGGSVSFKPDLPKDKKGRYVKVQIQGKNKEGNGHLSLAEVQVFGEFTK